MMEREKRLDAVVKALRDTAQSASNAVASNVSGPIDLISMGLRAAGVPVKKPFLGSEWMAEKGLTRDVEMGAPRIVGETLGMAGPSVAAAKAPQIAAALNQAQANAAAKSSLNPELGAIVWHGSPHKFDRFDSSKIGTGEGAQAYGHGIYLAQAPEVASGYRASVVPQGQKQFGLDDGPIKGIANLIAARGERGEEMARKAYAAQVPNIDKAIAEARRAIDATSSLYKVDLPDEAIAKMLDWDKPLSEQGEAVKGLLPKLNDWQRTMLDNPKFRSAWKDQYGSTNTGAVKYGELIQSAGGTVNAAEFLRQKGIPGIRYLDGGSRGAGAGTSNFVVFPGNEGMLTILERNNQPLIDALRKQKGQ